MRLLYVIVAVLGVLILSLAVGAQTRKVTQAEFDKLFNNASAQLNTLPHILKGRSSGPDGDSSREWVWELGSNDGDHHTSTSRDRGGESKMESYRVGLVKYVRHGNGAWEKQRLQKGGVDLAPSRAPDTSDMRITDEYFFVGDEQISGQKVAHYRHTNQTVKTSYPSSVERNDVKDCWFTADGLLVKDEYDDTTPNRGHYHTVVEYEYPKELIIKPPIP